MPLKEKCSCRCDEYSYDDGLYDALEAILYPRDRKHTVRVSSVPGVRKVYFNNKHTTIEWEDGVKTTVGCSKDQQFDQYNGFAAAFLKRMFGSSRAAVRYMNERKVVQPVNTKNIGQKAAECETTSE